jgi:tetratricopeptide (TPR) repeat protein
MAGTLTTSEEAQLGQTIEMFEVITQSQPLDYQSLEILKEAYFKLGREKDVASTSKRIAQAYVQLGQLSSAILEYETILQRFPDDPDVQSALKEIESKANRLVIETPLDGPAALTKLQPSSIKPQKVAGKAPPAEVEDGRQEMYKIFVDSKFISAGDFDLCWTKSDLSSRPSGVIEPFIQVLETKGIMAANKCVKILADRLRLAFLPLNTYEIDLELARSFPAETCQRWCVLPFDRMSKSVLVATANPFNRQAAKELQEATHNRLLWYLTTPADLINILQKTFR